MNARTSSGSVVATRSSSPVSEHTASRGTRAQRRSTAHTSAVCATSASDGRSTSTRSMPMALAAHMATPGARGGRGRIRRAHGGGRAQPTTGRGRSRWVAATPRGRGKDVAVRGPSGSAFLTGDQSTDRLPGGGRAPLWPVAPLHTLDGLRRLHDERRRGVGRLGRCLPEPVHHGDLDPPRRCVRDFRAPPSSVEEASLTSGHRGCPSAGRIARRFVAVPYGRSGGLRRPSRNAGYRADRVSPQASSIAEAASWSTWA